MRCNNCLTFFQKGKTCPSCMLYNAAVAAICAAAKNIADDRLPGSYRAWINEYGIFCFHDGVTHQVGSAEEAAPFAALTAAARAVKHPDPEEKPWPTLPGCC